MLRCYVYTYILRYIYNRSVDKLYIYIYIYNTSEPFLPNGQVSPDLFPSAQDSNLRALSIPSLYPARSIELHPSMRKVLSATAIGCCSLRLVEAGSFKWNANKARDDLDWTPARATPTAGYHQPASMLPNPEPTTPPVRRRRDTSDANSVCGYFSGIACMFPCPSRFSFLSPSPLPSQVLILVWCGSRERQASDHACFVVTFLMY